MSTFEVPILEIDDVYDHPNADRLSILRIRGYEAITNKDADGHHRFGKGEPIIYVPEGAVVPEAHLKTRGYWNTEKDTGLLAGTKGNRVKAISLRGVLSQGLVWKIDDHNPEDGSPVVVRDGERWRFVELGDDVSEFYGIEKYVPKVPTSMDGLMEGIFETRFDYDIENIKAYPELFGATDEVVVTEKLHGTFARISYILNMDPNDKLFGDGRVAISTKGMGASGLSFINVPANAGNLYVQAFSAGEFIERFMAFAEERCPGYSVHLMGEVFGPGVQDLHYGQTEKQFRAFDVALTNAAGTIFLDETDKDDFFKMLGVDRVPVLYWGPFNREVIDKLASGSTTVGRKQDATDGPNVREGVVITAAGDQSKRTLPLGRTLRPILKHVSDAYLTRKGGTEYQ